MNKNFLTILTISLIVAIFIIFFGQSNIALKSKDLSAQNVEIRDGVQYITINAKGGYSPKLSKAKANIPTKLIVKTNNTFDCSSSLVIKSIDYQKILPQTGEEIIDLNVPKSGIFQGFCSMGMYSFKIDFQE